MAFLEIRSQADRNKLIVAILLGVLALATLWFAFGGSLTGSKPNVTAAATPRPSATPRRDLGEVKMPSQNSQDLVYQSTPIFYDPSSHFTSDPGRNIFSFYEPPPPCPECPTPTPKPTPIVMPTPLPEAPYAIGFVTPQSVYAGAKTFRLEVNGDRFTPEARINFNGVELPTNFISAQRVAANVPANMIAGQGSAQIVVRSPDGSKYSYPTMIAIQPPPKPNFQYIGMIARKLGNNDTGYFMEQGKQTPTGARLNDVMSGRFKLVDLSSEKAVFEDVNLGFRHTVELYRPAPGTGISTGAPTRGNFPQPGGFVPYNPGMPTTVQGIPGIPNGIPRYIPPGSNSNTGRPVQKKEPDDVDDEDTDNK